ncbi:hypothetical protein K2Z83_26850 [Oscillochloris sp. ZM17-4]|uniref:hypothetical protein n=1 Tax=Oscillochloris sp. ZM17-4 TaxID=2866714 RepID=UPI001C72F26D|nr:hypothetical protein [Oscillochloris sp. ZM17-4]MBX0331273.1 hypothetical protein [Oscillochloris sp. ZM17-4]
MITASLILAGHTTTLTWEVGMIAGEPGAVAYVQALGDLLEGRAVALPSFAGTTTNHLQDAMSFMALCVLASDRYPSFTGDLSDLDQSGIIPEGVDL